MDFNQGQGLAQGQGLGLAQGQGYGGGGGGGGGGMTNPYLMANAGVMGNYNMGGQGQGQGLGGYNTNGMGGHLDHPLLNPLLHPHHAPQALPQIYSDPAAKGGQHNNNGNPPLLHPPCTHLDASSLLTLTSSFSHTFSLSYTL